MSRDTTEPVAAPANPPFHWEALLESACQFARASVDNYSVQDSAFFYLHAGASVELGIKAALCRISPVLLVEGGGRFSDKALIRLMGYQPASAVNTSADRRPIFTVGFEQAIKRFELLYGDEALGVDPASLQLLKAARDVTAHGGAVGEAATQTLLNVLVVLCSVHAALAPLLGLTPEEFWGPAFTLVQKASQQMEDQIRQQLQTLYAASRRRFDERFGDVDEETLSTLIEQANYKVQLSPGQTYRTCPVCGGTGLSHERPAKRTALSRRGSPSVQRGWMAIDFRCPMCKLNLESEQLVASAPHFEPWEAAEEELLHFWAEDVGDDLDSEDLDELGLGPFLDEDRSEDPD